MNAASQLSNASVSVRLSVRLFPAMLSLSHCSSTHWGVWTEVCVYMCVYVCACACVYACVCMHACMRACVCE